MNSCIPGCGNAIISNPCTDCIRRNVPHISRPTREFVKKESLLPTIRVIRERSLPDPVSLDPIIAIASIDRMTALANNDMVIAISRLDGSTSIASMNIVISFASINCIEAIST